MIIFDFLLDFFSRRLPFNFSLALVSFLAVLFGPFCLAFDLVKSFIVSSTER